MNKLFMISKFFMAAVGLAGCLGFSGTVAAKPASADETAKKPSVLIVFHSNAPLYSPEIFEEIHTDGFNVQYVNLVAKDWDKFRQLLPKANVVVMLSSGTGGFNDNVKSYHDAINEFAQRGGGVFFIPSERYMHSFACSTRFLPRWDAKLGVEYLYGTDPIEATTWKVNFAYTADIQPSSLTEGVRGLWVPVIKPGVNFGSSAPSLGIEFGAPWQVLIKSGPDIYSEPDKPESAELRSVTREIGYKPGEAPIFAVRTFGEGRLAATAINWPYFLGSAVKTTLEEIVWTRGLKDKPSDGKQLFLNTLHWLAAPSLNDPRRGFTSDTELFRPEDKPPIAAKWNWDRSQFKPGASPSLGGVIGARTAYSTGQGTVAEWKEAAKAAGLNFLAFLEDFKHLTQEELEALNRECKELSDDQILLMPGFYAEDVIGCKSYFFNAEGIPYPYSSGLAENGTVFGDVHANHERGLRPDGKVFRGQLESLRFGWKWDQLKTRVNTGWFDFKNGPVPAADLGTYDSVPVFTRYADGATEDSLPVYAEALRDKQYPCPVALEFVDSPEQLRRRDLWKTYVFANSMAELTEWFDARSSKRISTHINRQWVSSGPIIHDWLRLGGHDYAMANEDEYVWQNALMKMFLKVSAPNGLREVRFWSGDKIIRRYRPSGNEFTTELEIDKRCEQYEMFAEVIDQQGGRAVTTPWSAKNHILQQVNCADRNNQLCTSHIRRKDGTILKTWQMAATPNKRVDYLSFRPGSCFGEDDRIGLKAFDGMAQVDFPAVTEGLYLNTAAYHKLENFCQQGPWTDEENGSHHVAVSTFNSMDALVADRIVDKVFADHVDVSNVWRTRWKLQSREYSDWKQRRWVFRHRADEPLLLSLWEYELTLKKDVEYLPGAELGLLGPELNPGDARVWSVGPEGAALEPAGSGSYETPERKSIVHPFGVGAWVACLGGKDGGGAIVYSLTPELKVEAQGSSRGPSFRIGLPPELSPTKQGQTVKFKLAVIGIPRHVKNYTDLVSQADPAAVPAAVKQALGIGCDPIGEIVWEKGRPGKPEFVYPVAAEDGVVLAEFAKSPERIVPIPLLVSNLNPNWSVAACDLARQQARLVGQFEGQAPYMVDPQDAAMKLFIGHPVQCGDPNLTVQVVQTGDKEWSLEIHNPGDAAVSTWYRSAPEWPLFSVEGTVNLPSGASMRRSIATETPVK